MRKCDPKDLTESECVSKGNSLGRKENTECQNNSFISHKNNNERSKSKEKVFTI